MADRQSHPVDWMDGHPAGDDLENYSRGRLAPTRVPRLEEHLLVCERCRVTLGAIEPFGFVHITSDGPVYLRVTTLRNGRFSARLWGRQLDGAREFRTGRGARGYLVRIFSKMFPEHVCTARCGATGLPRVIRLHA